MSRSVDPRQRAAAALKSLFVADALAMPVHWYYNPMDIYRQFDGGIQGLEDAPAFHPSSIMSLHSTRKGGRGSQGSSQGQREIVGEVILKGRRRFWDRANTHYHHGMKAGENTLNAHCARVVMRCLAANDGHYDADAFLAAYIDFMTADPPRHSDTYAESYHRGFFANLEAGRPADRCGSVTHDTASIGGLVTIAPIVFSERLAGTPLDNVQDICVKHMTLTHPDAHLSQVCRDYVGLLDELLFLEDSREAPELISTWAGRSINLRLPELARKHSSDLEVVGRLFSPACYITDSWPSVLFLTYKYCLEQKAGLLANTNLGGDNVHRGAIMGTLLGLAAGETVDELFAELRDRPDLECEISALT